MDTSHTCNTRSFTLPEIAEWGQTTTQMVEIPAFQRGLVWNAAQIEVLWDSLLRGIPIGAFSLLSMKGNERHSTMGNRDTSHTNSETGYFLLDGQQRANAIATGFRPFPDRDKKDPNPILWIDLLPPKELQRRSNRKFFFYVTTPARPWGYRIDDANNENRPGVVSVAQWRAALEESKWIANANNKPEPKQLWPVCARLPIPFAILRKHPLSATDVIAASNNEPWVRHFSKVCAEASIPEGDITKSLHELEVAMDSAISNTRVMAMVAPDSLADTSSATGKTDEDDSEIALYFMRLNRGGTRPSREDLDYSILKSILPELHVIDDCAKDRMHPARLAHLAMLTFLSFTKDNEWKRTLSRHYIFTLRDNMDFVNYVNHSLPRDIRRIESWLLNKDDDYGLPPFLLSRLSHRQPNLYRFLLMLAREFHEDSSVEIRNIFPQLITAFCTTLAWFGDDGGLDFSSLVGRIGEITVATSSDAIRKILGAWIASQVERRAMTLPPLLDYFRCIENATNSKDPEEEVKKAWSDPKQSSAANKIWYWHTEEGRGLVLYACRKYLLKTFGKFDPAAAVWAEENRPWDYDHIVPQAWLKGTYHGNSHELVAKFLNSIGNIAPIPFTENRSKHDIPPGKINLYSAPDRSCDLFINLSLAGVQPKFVNEHTILEDDHDAAIDFARVTARRMVAIYQQWWNTLAIDKLLVECVPEARKKKIQAFAEILKTEIPETRCHIRTVFIAEDGTQADIIHPWDWSRPWISCGVCGVYRQTSSETSIPCFLCVTFQNNTCEYGLRRHPDESRINGKNEWWLPRHWNRGESEKFIEYAKSLFYGRLPTGESFALK